MFDVHPFSTFKIRCWTFDVRCSSFFPHSRFDVGRSMFDVHPFSHIQDSMLDVRCSMFVLSLRLWNLSPPGSTPLDRITQYHKYQPASNISLWWKKACRGEARQSEDGSVANSSFSAGSARDLKAQVMAICQKKGPGFQIHFRSPLFNPSINYRVSEFHFFGVSGIAFRDTPCARSPT